jgi:hypothetical protein
MFALPSYTTPYFGTSGWSGETKTYPWTPFPDFPLTWKAVFLDTDAPIKGYPNLSSRLGIDEYNISPEGHFNDRAAYFGFPLMGHCFAVAANMVKLHAPQHVGFPRLEKAFVRSAEGTLMGLKDNSGPAQFAIITSYNKRFPETAIGIAWMTSLDSTHSQSDNKLVPQAGVFGFAWYDDMAAFPSPPNRLRIQVN